MQNVFDAKEAQNYIDRINRLTPETQRKWGKMTVDQVLAHMNVAYETIYEPEKHAKPGFIAGFLLKNFVKSKTVNEIPYKQSIPTGPMFIIKGNRNFEEEKKRLIGFIQKTQQLGRESFDGKMSHSFGKLTAQEWNNMLAKHLNHHLEQFGV
ncbi:MAG: DinB family protein [Kaistella sp.]|nr:DinB family protein [Kaistella sp.]